MEPLCMSSMEMGEKYYHKNHSSVGEVKWTFKQIIPKQWENKYLIYILRENLLTMLYTYCTLDTFKWRGQSKYILKFCPINPKHIGNFKSKCYELSVELTFHAGTCSKFLLHFNLSNHHNSTINWVLRASLFHKGRKWSILKLNNLLKVTQLTTTELSLLIQCYIRYISIQSHAGLHDVQDKRCS